MKWKYSNMRDAFGKTLVELGRRFPQIVVLNADLSSSTRTHYFEKEFPERFWNVGVAEQNMMGIAAGLATTGKIVFASTFAMFATGRAYDQIRQSIAYPRLNVKIVASHAGITVGGDGASHQMHEDIALMRVLPHMTVIVPADFFETRSVISKIVEMGGPAYVRMARTDTPEIYNENYEFKIGVGDLLKEGDDVTIIAMGLMLSKAIEAAETLGREGVSCRVINMSTVKPIDEKAIEKAARETGAIVTAEEHNVLMGMGSAVVEVVAEKYPVPVRRIGIPDVFGESGESEELMEAYGLTTENIVQQVKAILANR
ncbi:MAG: transketolase family protein [Thermoplasmata archaeon]|nr:transketolase family protein [Thermoplasmata archaeon]RLF70988.1 MAG: transketolase family protein [Thermoplasmata archaeon]RLF71435.1 MAG: transketolase family protein [Thermoplasmata archaeon]HDD60584.1 transketolase family protein [Euryarchaeota archaeon]